MWQITLSQAQLRLIEPQLKSLDELSAKEVIVQIQELYAFLDAQIEVAIHDGKVTIHADVASELNKKGQKPDELIDPASVVEDKTLDFQNVVGEDSLTRFDDRKKKKKIYGRISAKVFLFLPLITLPAQRKKKTLVIL